MEVISLPDGMTAPVYTVQVDASQDRATAERSPSEMAMRYGQARLAERKENPGVWRVMVSHESTVDGAALSGLLRRENL
jgi:hypothetical protein